MENNEIINLFRNDINNIKKLSANKQLKLLKEAQSGNIKSRQKLIECNLPFILKIALIYKGNHIYTINDLINEGTLGLIRSIKSFDINKNVNFITYAVWWIKHYIQCAINEKDNIIRLPTSVIRDIKKQQKEKDNDNEMTFDAYKYMKMKKIGLSLDSKPNTNSESLLLADILPDKKYISLEHSIQNLNLRNILIESFLEILTDTEKYVIVHFFGINKEQKCLTNISADTGINLITVRFIRDNAIRKIRKINGFGIFKERYYDFLETEI